MIAAGDPRRPGGVYWSGYWREAYLVTRMFSTVAGRETWLSVEWHDGRAGSHCTPWDRRRDRIIRAPFMCPMCASTSLAGPYDNGTITDAIRCRACGATMTSEAATPGSDAHAFIWARPPAAEVTG